MIASLPMYDADRPAVARWWEGLADHLRDQGVAGVPAALLWPDELPAHWKDPALLLSQACGYPLMHALRHHVQVVGTLVYGAPGCEGIHYTSHVLVRDEEPGQTVKDFRDRVVAYNSVDSHSGYHALRALVAPLANQGRFFGRAQRSGGHRASLQLLQERQADIAAIDCVTLAGLSRAAPGLLRGLRRIASTTPVPGLPMVTARGTHRATLDALRRALHQAVSDPALADARAALAIRGFQVTNRSNYRVIAEQAAQADALGYSALP
ncbi:MAG: phosphate ABC transporter substrate-binding protein [Rubrivivax sp.]|nr:MAG: phosphate ABC transporter substrate-binding protein [Rubrivivax sp.]